MYNLKKKKKKGLIATVWDAEVTAVAEVLRISKGMGLLILSDSQAAIAAIVKAGRKGQGRTKELREAINLIARRCRNDSTAVCLGWVKSYVGIEGNEAADKEAKEAAEGKNTSEGTRRVTMVPEGGVRQEVSAKRQEERKQAGWGLGEVPKWGRRVAT